MQQEVYFMSQVERDAILGRLVREHSEQDALVNDLESEAKRFSSGLRLISDLLQGSPETVIFPGQVNHQHPLASAPNVNSSVLDADRIKVLVENLRNARAKREELAEQIRRRPRVD